MDKEGHLWFFFQFLHEVEKEISKEEEKKVMIEKAINLRLMCDYVVSCSYGDIVLIICMLHDYVKMLDEARADDIVYQAYYRGKFMGMADRLAAQIGYDYGEAVKKCMKKTDQTDKSDIGEDGLSHLIKRDHQLAKMKAKESRGKQDEGG